MDYKERIASNIAKITGLEQAKVSDLIEIPPQMSLGDYAFPCVVLAKTMHKAPAAIAQELCDNHELTDGAVTAKNAGPYVNFFIDRKVLAEEVLTEIILKGSRYGEENIGEGRNVIVEFSSPNIAKPFHVGHAFTTILGTPISAIYGKLGYNVVRFNHVGDYGTPFGKLITAYRLWGDEEALGKAPIDELLRIYVRFHEEAEKDPSLEDAARENFRKLEEGCSDEVALWERFRKLSLEVFEKTYNRMGVKFVNYNGESFYSSRIPAVVDMLREKGLLEESEGAQVVKLDDEGLPPCIILKSDGTTIYASRDLAAVLYRYENYHFDKNIYVVGLPQQLHFKQVFAVLRKAGYKCADDCVHVGFGLVKFKNNTAFSTRKGNIVLLDDLLNKTVEKTAEIIKTNAAARGDDMSADEIAEIAEKVGIGAVKYTYLKSGREKDILFDWDEMLDFEGDTAPYLIYTYARTRSILRKADSLGLDIASGSGLGLLTGDDEYAVIRNLADYKDSIRKAAASYEPFMVSRQIAVIARSYNRFYNNSSILSADSTEQKKARLALCSCVCEVLRSGLELLGINVVEKM